MIRITLDEFENWLYFKNSYAKASMYRTLYKKAFEYFIHIPLSEKNCMKFMETFHNQVENQEISPSTYNNYLKATRLLIKAHGLTFNLPLKRKKTEQGYIPTLEDSEVHRIVKYMYSRKTTSANQMSFYRQAVAYQLLVEHGLRFENVRYLEWSDVKDDELFIKKTKMNRSYDIQISAELKEKIEKLRHTHPQYVFASNKGLLHRQKFNEMMEKVLMELNIHKHITVHKLRHTNATLQADHDVNLKVIAENLGHRSVRTTEGYIHVSKKKKREAIRKLGISHFILSTDEIRKEVNKFVLYLNQGGCLAFVVPQTVNLVITVPLST